MTAAPRVSILTPTRNCADQIGHTIATVIAQSLPNWEMLVLDACSTDGTPDVVAQVGHPNITVVVEPDEGVAHAWDKGLMRATGDYVALLCGGDGYRDPTWLQTCSDIMDNDGDVSLVWGAPGHAWSYDGVVVIQPPWHEYLFDAALLESHQKTGWFTHWLRTGGGFPDTTMCVRRDVLIECMPRYRLGTRVPDRLVAFTYNFCSRGYLPYGVAVVPTVSLYHDGRLSDSRADEVAQQHSDYRRRVRRYRAQFIKDEVTQVFRDGTGRAIAAARPCDGRFRAEDFLTPTKDGQLVEGTEWLGNSPFRIEAAIGKDDQPYRIEGVDRVLPG